MPRARRQMLALDLGRDAADDDGTKLGITAKANGEHG